MAVTARQVADGIIAFCNDHGDLLTNLKLQKLLYYAQAWHLAVYGKELFPEDCEAWVHGPVVPSAYRAFRAAGYSPVNEMGGHPSLPARVQVHIADLMGAYGALSAFDMERLVHSEAPWREARGDLPPDAPSVAVIPKRRMREYYRAKLDEATEGRNS